MTTSNIKTVIRCDIHKVWETVLAVERYHTWRSDVGKTEVIDEKQLIEYTKDGYSTTFMVTGSEPYRRWELGMENEHIKGHWTGIFVSKSNETEIDFTASAAAKGLATRPIGKSVFKRTYLNKMQEQFVMDLKKSLGC